MMAAGQMMATGQKLKGNFWKRTSILESGHFYIYTCGLPASAVAITNKWVGEVCKCWGTGAHQVPSGGEGDT